MIQGEWLLTLTTSANEGLVLYNVSDKDRQKSFAAESKGPGCVDDAFDAKVANFLSI